MIFPAMYLMILALIPVIIVESFTLHKSLNLSFGFTVPVSAGANIASTIVGIPVTWLLLALFQLMTGGGGAFGIGTFWQKIIAVTWQAPWLMPYETEGYWIGYAAMLFLLIPFFFASWKVEYWVSRRHLALAIQMQRETDVEETDVVMKKLLLEGYWAEISRSWRNANLFSYGSIALFLMAMLISAISS